MTEGQAIFISYRRKDAAGHARALHEYLIERFGNERVFFDRSTIESGDLFLERIRKGVKDCAALLALIGPGWIDAANEKGHRRLDSPDDLVRTEISLAIRLGKKVIPILFDETPIPETKLLPQPLKKLKSFDTLELRGKTTEYQTARRELVRLLAKVPGIPDPYPEPGDATPEPSGISELIKIHTSDYAQITDAQRQTIEVLKRQIGANDAQLCTFFRVIGEANVPPDQQWSRLNEIAALYRKQKELATGRPGDNPEVAKLKQEATTALESGQLDKADQLLVQIESVQDVALNDERRKLEAQQRDIEKRQLERASTSAQRGGLALTRLRYAVAAEHFAAAAKLVPPGYDEQAFDYLDREATALYRKGEEFGDNDALVAAADRLRVLLDRRPRHLFPLDWSATQHKLGTVLSSLGRRELSGASLEKSVEAYREALKERTRERCPLDWAATQNNLGVALMAMSRRGGTLENWSKAEEAFGEALKERTRARVPSDWASTQMNLAGALVDGQELFRGTEYVAQAIELYRESLNELSREGAPLQWANTQCALGAALTLLGERESGTVHLKQALDALLEALHVQTRERVPLAWAATQNNMGNVLLILGVREASTARLEEAVNAYSAALCEKTRERVPLEWAKTQINLSNALTLLGEKARNVDSLRKARTAIDTASKVFIQGLEGPFMQEIYRADFEKRIREIDEKILLLNP